MKKTWQLVEQKYHNDPVQEPKPSKLERSWEPGPATGSRFTDEEMRQMTNR